VRVAQRLEPLAGIEEVDLSTSPQRMSGEFTRSPKRTWLTTLPPRWATPWTSDCFASSPSAMAASASVSLATSTPWPPTPAIRML